MPRYCAIMLILNSKTTSETTLVESSLTHIKTAKKDYYIDNMNRRQGEFKLYHESGQLLLHCFFVDDCRQGEFKIYHDSGQLHVHCFYADGVHHGEFKSYHDNGELYIHCFYIDDTDVTDEVNALVSDVRNITNEEKVILKLKLGYDV